MPDKAHSPKYQHFMFPRPNAYPYLHLATSEMWFWSGEKGMKKNCLCVMILCTIIMVHKGTSSYYRSVDCIGLWSCLV